MGRERIGLVRHLVFPQVIPSGLAASGLIASGSFDCIVAVYRGDELF